MLTGDLGRFVEDGEGLIITEPKKAQKYNPYHEPAGSPTGGQFTTGPGEGASGGASSIAITSDAKLTADEINAAEEWIIYGDNFDEIQGKLRFGGKLDAEQKQLTEDLTSAINKASLSTPMTLTRGFSSGEDDFGRNPGQDLLNKMRSMQIGDTFVDAGFMATSRGTASSDYGPGGTGLPGAIMTIRAPAGTKALQFAAQGETLLQRGTYLVMRERNATGDAFTFDVYTQKPPKLK